MSKATTRPTRGEIADIARGVLSEELEIGQSAITYDSVLRELPGADSIHLLHVFSLLEGAWDTEFEDEDIFKSTTFAELVDMVSSYLQPGN